MVSYLCAQVGKEVITIAGSQLRGGSRGWRSSLAQSIPVAPVSRRVNTKSFLCLQGGAYTTCPRACSPTSSLRSQFLFAALTNYHTPSGFKQPIFILLQVCRLEIQPGCHWAKLEVSAGLRSFCRLWGEAVSSHFPPSRGRLHSLACGPFVRLQRQQWCMHLSGSSSLVKSPSDPRRKGAMLLNHMITFCSPG